jgi:hypothetical protein
VQYVGRYCTDSPVVRTSGATALVAAHLAVNQGGECRLCGLGRDIPKLHPGAFGNPAEQRIGVDQRRGFVAGQGDAPLVAPSSQISEMVRFLS